MKTIELFHNLVHLAEPGSWSGTLEELRTALYREGEKQLSPEQQVAIKYDGPMQADAMRAVAIKRDILNAIPPPLELVCILGAMGAVETPAPAAKVSWNDEHCGPNEKLSEGWKALYLPVLAPPKASTWSFTCEQAKAELEKTRRAIFEHMSSRERHDTEQQGFAHARDLRDEAEGRKELR